MEENDKETKTEEGKPSEKEEKETEKKPLNMVEEARAIRGEIREQKEALIKEREELQKVQSEALLSGTAAGHIETEKVSEEDKKTNQATKYFKDTALGDAIKKANKKDE